MGDQPVDVVPADRPRPSWLRRSARRTNVGLMVLLIGAFASGWFAFATGAPTTATLTTAVHGLFGVAVVALLPWKSMIIRRSTRWRLVGLVLSVLVIGCLLAGFVQLFAGYAVVLGLTPIQVHVGAAVGGFLLLIGHVLRHRRQVPRRSDLSRRMLLQDGALGLGVAAGYAVLGAAAVVSRPDRPRAPTGSRPLEPAVVPATTWLFDRIPNLDPDQHRVAVAGTSFSIAELEARAEPVSARLDCTNGWYADLDWLGVRLADLLPAAELARGLSLRVRSVTGYERAFPVDDADRLWLAVSSGGRALTPGRGAPVRLVAPGRRGFWWVKWVTAVEVSDQPAWQQPPFPLQ